MVLAPRIPKVLDGEVYFQFTKEEIARSAEPFRYSVVLKFLKNRPSLDAVVSYGPRPFRFQNMWTSHGDFKRCVEEVWKLPTTSVGLFRLAEKLKKTKIALRAWNIQVFGHVGQNIKELEERLEVLESRLQDGYDQDVECDFLVTKLELETWERREEIRFSQLAKKKWISEGDNNTKFFHAVVNQRRKSKIISNMQLENGDFLNSPEQVDLAPLIQCSVTEENNLALIMAPSETEILDALKSIPKDSSPGPDGFGSGFYRSCWDLINEDVVAAAKDFTKILYSILSGVDSEGGGPQEF
ncbi:uncharacterized protein LOC118349893 [Juglans regia]|uniref:Uncharacterized protein LOC118349893 n=1 Tax=Juglans regia TaxID=51240 RepID=A0A6P9F764_JUGRE|nr:uncharacterized protein LOC118349893 [Juglans regia]